MALRDYFPWRQDRPDYKAKYDRAESERIIAEQDWIAAEDRERDIRRHAIEMEALVAVYRDRLDRIIALDTPNAAHGVKKAVQIASEPHSVTS